MKLIFSAEVDEYNAFTIRELRSLINVLYDSAPPFLLTMLILREYPRVATLGQAVASLESTSDDGIRRQC